jgi:hypothetical protein
MNTSIVPKFIVNLFAHEIERVHKLLLYEISKDYNIPYNELENKYITNVDINHDKIQIVKKRNYNTNLDTKNRCIAYNAQQQQCQRSKGGNKDFCPIHLKCHRYGTIHNKCVVIKEKQWSKLY